MELIDFKASIPSFIQQAIDTGSRITNGKTVLIPSLSCIENLDSIVDYLHSLWTKGLINDTVAWNAAVSFGVLLGEMIIKEHCFHWILDDGLPVIETEENNRLSPITKIYKIITDEDDCEGSPSGFYEGFQALQRYQNMSEEEKESITTYYIEGRETDS